MSVGLNSWRGVASAVGLAFLLSSSTVLQADEVLMKNGDRLTGSVVRQEGNTLNLKTTYAGTLELDWSQVSEVVFEEAKPLLLQDERVLEVKAVRTEEGTRPVLLDAENEPLPVTQEQVKVLNPEPWEMGRGGKFSGSFHLALKNEAGNSESSELDADLKLNYRLLRYELQSYTQVEYDTTRGARSSDNWSSFNNVDRLFRTPWYVSYQVALKHDRFADLRMRVLTGLSPGYRFVEAKVHNLKGEIGAAYLNDDFYDAEDESYWGSTWYLEGDQYLWKDWVQLYHRQLGFISVNDTDKYLWRAWTGIRVYLVAGFTGSVEYEIDYDSRPAVETESTDETLRLKLGYKW